MNHAVQTSGSMSKGDVFHPMDSLRMRLHHLIARASNSTACAMLLKYRRLVLIVGQLGLVVLSNYVAFTLRFDGRIPAVEFARFIDFLPWLLITRGLAFWPFRVYEGLWKYTGISDVCNILKAVALSSALCLFLVVRPVTGLSALGDPDRFAAADADADGGPPDAPPGGPDRAVA